MSVDLAIASARRRGSMLGAAGRSLIGRNRHSIGWRSMHGWRCEALLAYRNLRSQPQFRASAAPGVLSPGLSASSPRLRVDHVDRRVPRRWLGVVHAGANLHTRRATTIRDPYFIQVACYILLLTINLVVHLFPSARAEYLFYARIYSIVTKPGVRFAFFPVVITVTERCSKFILNSTLQGGRW